MHKALFVVLFLIFSNSISSQTKTISGVVVDAKDKTPITDVNVFIEDTSIGVITNDNGNFKIVFPSDKKKLIISHVGYSKKILFVDEIDSISQILLEPKKIVLDEVVVTQKKLESNPILIMEKAFAKLSSNSGKQPFFAEAFIRHTERSVDRFELLIESALEIYDPGVDTNPKEIKINVSQTRKSLDYRIIDTVKFYRRYLNATNKLPYKKNYEAATDYKSADTETIQKAIAYYDNHYTAGYSKDNDLMEKVLTTDINKLRFFNQKKASFNTKSLKRYSFELDSVLQENSDNIYKIKFANYSKRKKELSVGWFYVRNRDFAIIKLQFSQVLGSSHYLRKIINGSLRYSTTIKYKEHNKVMYPFYISHKAFKLNRGLIQTMNEDEDLSYYTHEEILFHSIYTDRKKINAATVNSELWDSDIFKPRHYEELFWSKQNIILESDKNQKMRIDLEQRVKLKEQFSQTNR